MPDGNSLEVKEGSTTSKFGEVYRKIKMSRNTPSRLSFNYGKLPYSIPFSVKV